MWFGSFTGPLNQSQPDKICLELEPKQTIYIEKQINSLIQFGFIQISVWTKPIDTRCMVSGSALIYLEEQAQKTCESTIEKEKGKRMWLH